MTEIVQALRDLIGAAQEMPRQTPGPGAASTLHHFELSAAAVWGLDKAIKNASAALASHVGPAATPASPELREQIKDTINRVVTVKERWDGLQILEGLDAAATAILALAAAPQAQEDELYRIRDLIASHIACEKDCQEMPSGCGCALAAARAVVTRPERAIP